MIKQKTIKKQLTYNSVEKTWCWIAGARKGKRADFLGNIKIGNKVYQTVDLLQVFVHGD